MDVDELAQTPTGLLLLQALLAADVAEVRSDHDVLEIIAAWDRVISWANARQLAAIAEFARRPVVFAADDEAGWARRRGLGIVAREHADDEIAARLGMSRVAASGRLSMGVALAGKLPETQRALANGCVDVAKARVIAEECANLAPDVAHAVETKVLTRAPEQNCTRLRQALRRALVSADPVAAGEKAKAARNERHVFIRPLPDEMAELYAVVPAADAVTIDTALTAAARAMKAARTPGDDRTIEQLRADALTAPFVAALHDGVLAGTTTKLARFRGARAQLNVTVPASVLLGITNAPGELAGYGPVSAETARMIARDATWRRLITDPVDGTLLSVEEKTYRPSVVLDRFVKARDNTCRAPMCNWPALACDLDHTMPYPKGTTTARNLGPLCERHHGFKGKDPSGRRLTQTAPGVFRWIMPTGHAYTVRPASIAMSLREEMAHGSDPPIP